MKGITKWILKSPKTSYLIAISLLFLSTIFSIVRIFNSPDKDVLKKQDIPVINKYDLSKKETSTERKMKLEWITSELESYQEKVDSNKLNKIDSMRIDKLYNEYLRLKNGN